MGELVPWDRVEEVYLRYFDQSRRGVVKRSRLILGLMIGQMITKESDRQIVDSFHENPYFQCFCGEDSFRMKLEKSVIHHSLLSKRRRRLGEKFIQEFEDELLVILKEKGLIKTESLILDATVFQSNIRYPSDVKLLNEVRDWGCKMLLKFKNVLDPSRKIRTYRASAEKVFLRFQKTKRKTSLFIRKSRNQMLRFVNRNLGQLDTLIAEIESKSTVLHSDVKGWVLAQAKERLTVAKEIYAQQLSMSKTKGRRIANRIVSFHQPQIRPIVRGKEGVSVEFGAKAHVSLVGGFAFLDHCSFDAFHEGTLLPDSLAQYEKRFEKKPETVLADQLYATRANRLILKNANIESSFRPIGRPPDIPNPQRNQNKILARRRHGQRNFIEATFGHLKQRFNLGKIKFRIPDGPHIQIRLGLIAANLHRAIA